MFHFVPISLWYLFPAKKKVIGDIHLINRIIFSYKFRENNPYGNLIQFRVKKMFTCFFGHLIYPMWTLFFLFFFDRIFRSNLASISKKCILGQIRSNILNSFRHILLLLFFFQLGGSCPHVLINVFFQVINLKFYHIFLFVKNYQTKKNIQKKKMGCGDFGQI